MPSLYVPDEEFALLKARYDSWKSAGFEGIDDGMLPVLEAFNALPGVVTVTSCTGHPEKTSKPKTPFYIYAAVTQRGYTYLFALYEHMAKRLLDVGIAFQLNNASAGLNKRSYNQVYYRDFSLVCGFRDVELDGGETLTYHCWQFFAKGTHVGYVRNNFFKELLIALDKVNKEVPQDAPQHLPV